MEPWELTDEEMQIAVDSGHWRSDPHRKIATAAGRKVADRTQQLLGDWAYLDEAEFVQKYQIKKTFLPHLYAEWLKGAGTMKNPCITECEHYGVMLEGLDGPITDCQGQEEDCPTYARYLGYQECQKDMEKCGPNPCEQCHEWAGLPTSCNRYLNCNIACPDYRGWLGQQQGLAEAESRVRPLLHECKLQLEYLNASQERGTTNNVLAKIEDYCREKGWMEA